MPWTFFNSSGEAMIIDGGVQNPAGANFDISSYKLVGNGGSTGITISANGEVNMAAQPCVLAYNSADDANVTGNNTLVTVDFDTEVFDQNADFASDTFTAPITGRYLVCATVRVKGVTTSIDEMNLRIVASNRTFVNWNGNTHALSAPNNGASITHIVDMDAADTATIQLQCAGEGSDVNDIDGDAQPYTAVSICLLA